MAHVAGPAASVRRATTTGLVAPVVAALAVLFAWPLSTLARRSVESGDGSISFENYRMVLTSERYVRAFGVTAVLAVASTVLALVLCVPAAVFLEVSRSRVARCASTALSIPLSLPGIVIGFFIIVIFGNSGLIPDAAASITGEKRFAIAYTAGGLLLGYLYFQIPRIVLVVRAAAAGLSWDAIHASRTLGAGPWTTYRRVVLPALKPSITSAAGLSLATAFGAYGTAATLSRGVEVVPLQIAARFTERFEPAVAATLSLILAAITTVCLLAIGRPSGRT
jgi:putative spermidine/putrescine transport system permease protein